MGSMLYYVTYKYVMLKDARLGLLYYILAFLTVLFTVVEIFVKKGYMEFDTHPQGTVKLILSDDFSDDQPTSTGDLTYCNNGSIPCLYLDPWDLNWPIESRAVTITTLAKDRIQLRNHVNSSQREEYEQTIERVYFTQTPENVVIKVDHAVVATKFTHRSGQEGLAASHRQLRGYLVDSEGETLREMETGRPNKLSIKELLTAAGVKSLDELSDTVNAKGRTFRERGCIIRVVIFYHNWLTTWMGTSDVVYTYRVHRVPFVDYSSKQVEPLLTRDEILASVGVHEAQWRLQRKRYAIRVEFEQAGTLGMFSLPTLLFKLVSGMGLLTLTATVIDTLALYVLPNRNKYRKSVFEETVLKEKLTEKKNN